MNKLSTQCISPGRWFGAASPLLAILLGAAAFVFVVGPAVLPPSNLGWLGAGDPLTHFLGWQFFRSSPWEIPLGLNPRYGLDVGSSIVYSDSLPLLAIPLKLLSPLLPSTFQYFGLWLLGCFVLQAWFSWKLLGLFVEDGLTRLLGCVFFVFAPPMLWRMFGHLSLAGHFLIVAALYLHFRPNRVGRVGAWAALMVAASAAHPYLLFMIAPLWAGSLTTMCLVAHKARASTPYLRLEAVGIPLLVLFACWQLGYFTVGRSATNSDGYGLYRLNLLSPINPLGWSRTVGDLLQGPGDYEGFNFLGLGMLAIGCCGLPILVQRHAAVIAALRRQGPLVAALVALTLFAITNHIGIGEANFTVRIPPRLGLAANTFRASGRVFWPVYYAILLGALSVVSRAYTVRTARLLLAFAVVLQLADTSRGWEALKPHYAATSSPQLIPTSLVDPFWSEAAKYYREVRLVTPSATHPNWAIFAEYAARNRLGTNAIYMARVDEAKLVHSIESASRSVETGDYARDVLYILDDDQLIPALMHATDGTNLISRFDGFNVVAPGWKACAKCRQPPSEVRLQPLLAALRPVTLGDHIDFATPTNAGRFLLGGFWTPEEPGTWSKGRHASLMFMVSGPMPRSIAVQAAAFVLPSHPEQRLEFRVNGGPVIPVTLAQSKGNRFELPVPVATRAGPSSAQVLLIEVTSLNPARPVDLGLNSDTRALSFGLTGVDLH